MTYEAHLVHINRLDNQSFWEHVERLTGASIQTAVNEVAEELNKEIKNMASAQDFTGTTFNVGDKVKIGNGTIKYNVGTITKLYAQVELSPSSTQNADIDHLTHYQGPESVEDAWERVTMDIGSTVSGIVGVNGDQSWVWDSQKRTLRHDAYVVLGSVLKVDEEVKAKVRGIIERAEKRFTDRQS